LIGDEYTIGSRRNIISAAVSTLPTESPAERGLLVGAALKRPRSATSELEWSIDDSLDELAQLAWTAGVQVQGRATQRLEKINPATYIGAGKVEEIKELTDDLQCDIVIFDDELSPRQQRELEKALDRAKIIDRTALILDIFAQHAHTKEGALQVELAQHQYRLPRLTRAWTHLARQAGGASGRGGTGGVGLRGPGETQLEVDQREIRRRIARLSRELETVREHRRQHRQRRRRAELPVVALVGYTNAGKSTLLNTLAGSDVLVEDKLFATLDPTTRRVQLPGGRTVLVTDTVGFIQKLPPMLVAAFRATLEEINEADVLLHVVDITHAHVAQQSRAVGEVLEDLGATSQPVLMALNKIDRLDDPDSVEQLVHQFPNSVALSAATGRGIEGLLDRLTAVLESTFVAVSLFIPYSEARILSQLGQLGSIEQEEHLPDGVKIRGRFSSAIIGQLRRFVD